MVGNRISDYEDIGETWEFLLRVMKPTYIRDVEEEKLKRVADSKKDNNRNSFSQFLLVDIEEEYTCVTCQKIFGKFVEKVCHDVNLLTFLKRNDAYKTTSLDSILEQNEKDINVLNLLAKPKTTKCSTRTCVDRTLIRRRRIIPKHHKQAILFTIPRYIPKENPDEQKSDEEESDGEKSKGIN